MTDNAPSIFNCADFSPRELSAKLIELDSAGEVQLINVGAAALPSGQCSGLSQKLSIDVHGGVGDFFYLLGAESSVDVRGDAGDCLGHSMVSGSVIVHGNIGRCAAAYATGGFLAVLGRAAERCAQGLAGADVFVRSKVGDGAGLEMCNGTLILGNGAGEGLGEGMSGGVIYVRGEVKSLAPNLQPTRIKDADAMRLSLLLVRAGIKANSSDFKAFRARGGAR